MALFEGLFKGWGYLPRSELDRALAEAKQVIEEERAKANSKVEENKRAVTEELTEERLRLESAREMLLQLREDKDAEITRLQKEYAETEASLKRELEKLTVTHEKEANKLKLETEKYRETAAQAQGIAKKARYDLGRKIASSEKTRTQLITRLVVLEKRLGTLIQKTSVQRQKEFNTIKTAVLRPKNKARQKPAKPAKKPRPASNNVVLKPELVVKPKITLKQIAKTKKKAKKTAKKTKIKRNRR